MFVLTECSLITEIVVTEFLCIPSFQLLFSTSINLLHTPIHFFILLKKWFCIFEEMTCSEYLKLLRWWGPREKREKERILINSQFFWKWKSVLGKKMEERKRKEQYLIQSTYSEFHGFRSQVARRLYLSQLWPLLKRALFIEAPIGQ
jgi:hypothetical protein